MGCIAEPAGVWSSANEICSVSQTAHIERHAPYQVLGPEHSPPIRVEAVGNIPRRTQC